MTNPTCACGRRITDQAYLCWTCTNGLERDLGDLPAILAELNTTRLRQGRTASESAGGKPGTREGYDQLPDERPTEALDELRTQLVGWARIVVEEHATAWPADTVVAVARFLMLHLDWLRRQEAAAEVKNDLGRSLAKLRSSVDQQPERIYAGPCLAPLPDGSQCPEHLMTVRGARRIVCRACRAVYDPAEQQSWLLAAAEDQLAPAFVLAQAVTNLGKPITAATIRGYAFRGRLLEHGLDLDGRPLYRVGDVLDLIHQEASRHARPTKRQESA
jgi:hypothetical protein